MRTKTTQIFTAICAGLATNYGVASVSENFAVEPTIEQKLYDKVYESAEFLTRINHALVDDLVGQSVFMSAGSGVTGRAGVDEDGNNERQTKDVSGLSKREYRCYEEEIDVHLSWAKMDAWSKFPDFHNRYRNHVRQQKALDIIKIGWHGIKAEPITDLAKYPMMQDVNIGWLQLLRRDAPERVIKEGAVTGEIRIGEGGDYENLDCAVHDLIQGIPLHKRVGLVAIIGDELIAQDKGKHYAKNAHTPSEKTKVEMAQVINTYGGLPSFQVSFFPSRGILVTSFDNLSHYIQSGSTRMSIENNAKKKRVEDYESRNACYYVEDLEKAVYIESDSVKTHKAEDGTWS
ncbi:phage major capsid protein, P2 family [Pseudoalteromonas luteoviolacea]|uniref:Phage major capsid protein, P2 family n=1 Tax=Pseudoalteromonas luteoviolacea TaxID=43657 RepID=A0A1C0TVP2_9GAMM|nr:phage major capsid protein, P2 family [Pseudoalteromonas luteoviolacea]OCQ23382.1 phage major capsid protein, P2 family [Pseudoalteromonas luteoviolacea]